MNSNTNTTDEHAFISECVRALGFLIDEYGFTKPEIHSYPNLIAVFFCKDEVAIECDYDMREQDITVRISRLVNGQVPKTYRKDDQGAVVRASLMYLLRQRGVHDFDFPPRERVDGISEQQAEYRRELNGYASILKKYGEDILEGSAAIFNKSS